MRAAKLCRIVNAPCCSGSWHEKHGGIAMDKPLVTISQLALAHNLGTTSKTKGSTTTYTTTFAMRPIPADRPTSGSVTVKVPCGTCGETVLVKIDDAKTTEVTLGKKKGQYTGCTALGSLLIMGALPAMFGSVVLGFLLILASIAVFAVAGPGSSYSGLEVVGTESGTGRKAHSIRHRANNR